MPSSYSEDERRGCPRNRAATRALLSTGPFAAVDLTSFGDMLRGVKAVLRDSLSASGVPSSRFGPEESTRTRNEIQASLVVLDEMRRAFNLEAAERRRLRRQLVDSRVAPRRASAWPRADEMRMGEDLERRQPNQTLAVLRVDVGGLNDIRATHGDAKAAHVLEIAAARLAGAVRAADRITPLDGQELACFLDGIPSRERLSHLACKVLEAVSAPVLLGAVHVTPCPSIGIAISPADGTSPQQLLEAANAALYLARQHESGYAFSDEQAAVWASQFAHL